MKIIFLDMDGVLNCRTSRSRCGMYLGIDDDKLMLLKNIVDQTSAIIVLVSTWKHGWQKCKEDKYKQDELANYLDKKFKKFGLGVFDKTSDISACSYLSRGEGILEYMNCNKAESCVILDDFQFDYDGCGLTDNYVKTDNRVGLTQENIQQAIKILKRE